MKNRTSENMTELDKSQSFILSFCFYKSMFSEKVTAWIPMGERFATIEIHKLQHSAAAALQSLGFLVYIIKIERNELQTPCFGWSTLIS
jgi:hypothetical protein